MNWAGALVWSGHVHGRCFYSYNTFIILFHSIYSYCLGSVNYSGGQASTHAAYCIPCGYRNSMDCVRAEWTRLERNVQIQMKKKKWLLQRLLRASCQIYHWKVSQVDIFEYIFVFIDAVGRAALPVQSINSFVINLIQQLMHGYHCADGKWFTFTIWWLEVLRANVYAHMQNNKKTELC